MVVVLGTITVTFFLSHLVPSNPAILFAGQSATPQQVQVWNQRLGLDKPLYVQFALYVENIFTGNFGNSFQEFAQEPVILLLQQSLPNSLTLAAISTLVAAVVGIPLGVEAAKRGGHRLDSFLRVFSVSFVAIPQFWLALLLQLALNVELHVLPLASYGGTLLYTQLHPIKTITGSFLIDSLLTGNFSATALILWSLILPVIALSAYPIGVVMRQTRSAMLGVLSENYIRTARAYGVSEREVNYRYALRNALPTIIVILAIAFAGSTVGVVYVEQVFALQPGLGRLIADSTGTGISVGAIGTVDYPVVLGVTIVTAIIYSLSNFAADLLHIYFDRRLLS